MTVGVTVSVEVKIDAALRDLGLLPKQVASAGARAITRAANSGRTEAVRSISTISGDTQQRVRQRTYVSGASRNKLEGRIGGLPSATNVGRYRGANPRATKGGVLLKAWGRSNLYDKAFMFGTDPRKRVFKRRGKQKPRGLWGPSVRKELLRAPTLPLVLKKVNETFDREFDTALRFYMLGRG